MTNQSQIWELDYKQSWALKNWCFWTVVLEKTLESPLDCKEIQPVHPKGDQAWVFIGRTDVETETPILWPPDWNSTELRNKDVFAYYKLHSVRLMNLRDRNKWVSIFITFFIPYFNSFFSAQGFQGNPPQSLNWGTVPILWRWSNPLFIYLLVVESLIPLLAPENSDGNFWRNDHWKPVN